MEEQEIWSVLDASKIQNYMTCPRRFFFERVLGWQWAQPNVHLVFGRAWHLAMEVLYSAARPRYTQAGEDLPALLSGAFIAFYAEYEKSFSPEVTAANAPKTPENALRALQLYVLHHREDCFDVLHVETAGTVPISSTRVLHFKTDLICHDERGYFSLEHKTSSHFTGKWAAQWRQKMQGGAYTHVLYCLFPPEDVYGVLINGVFVQNTPRIKRDGTPYANATDNEFHRVPIRKNPRQMDAWLAEAVHWFDEIEMQHDILASETEGQDVMLAFPKNTESCTGYGVCPFLDYCSVWTNPLRHVEEIPSGFVVDMWDPRRQYHKEELTV